LSREQRFSFLLGLEIFSSEASGFSPLPSTLADVSGQTLHPAALLLRGEKIILS
jgi:hypothetical protein